MRRRQSLNYSLAMAMLTVLASCGSEDESGYRLEVSHRVEFEPIGEMSGIVQNPLDGSFWVHNDSGDEPQLFAIDAQGRVQIPENLANDYHSEEVEPGKEPWPGVRIENAVNQDWEDVTSDGVNLYIADMGNNRNARRNLGIYVVPWDSLSDTQAATATRFIPVHYPEQTGFPRWNAISTARACSLPTAACMQSPNIGNRFRFSSRNRERTSTDSIRNLKQRRTH
ncbi:MAG: hypothetical protein OXG90_06145 [Gammaproteobacteria bacterium]|nr:hypothetical protein [Gammaproteobacteria bacterium]